MESTKLVKECTQENVVRYFIKREDGTFDHLKSNLYKDGTLKKSKYISKGLNHWAAEEGRNRLTIYRGYIEQPISMV